jgi:hypothetical protein
MWAQRESTWRRVETDIQCKAVRLAVEHKESNLSYEAGKGILMHLKLYQYNETNVMHFSFSLSRIKPFNAERHIKASRSEPFKN